MTVRVPRLDPAAVLARGAGRPRGFWARGDRWVAHFGSIRTFGPRIREGARERDGTDTARSGDRFDPLWASASRVFGAFEELRAPPGEAGKPPRIYGGFSFRVDGPGPSAAGGAEPDFWADFPASYFVLPAVEVVGKGDYGLVTVRSDGPERDGSLLLDRAREIGDRMAEPPDRRGRRGSRVRIDPTGGAAADREPWRAAVEEALAWIGKGRISKVVLARVLDLAGMDVEPHRVVLNLWRQNPGTHVFLFEPEEGASVVGAAPETVATVFDGVFKATAVAGSISRGAAPEDQEALALKLLESEKDREEHALAVRDMVERLQALATEVGWDSEPHVLTLSGIQHLETHIQARLERGRHILSVLGALHPTPAVCGLPREAALDFLRMEERFDRGWYAGPVGWFNAAGDGVFAPALRSAVRKGDRWRLFAGAGIVDGSDPAREWEETKIKFEPVLRALSGGLPERSD